MRIQGGNGEVVAGRRCGIGEQRNEHTKYLSAKNTTDRADGGFEKGAELDAF
jgi:hypothetical protein